MSARGGAVRKNTRHQAGDVRRQFKRQTCLLAGLPADVFQHRHGAAASCCPGSMLPSWNSLRVEGWRQRLELFALQAIQSGPLKSQLPYLLLLRLHMQEAAVSSSVEQNYKTDYGIIRTFRTMPNTVRPYIVRLRP